MTLTRGEMQLLSKVQQSGDDGLLWTRFNSIVARDLHRKGLIEFRMGSLSETTTGQRTGMRFVVVDDQKLRRD